MTFARLNASWTKTGAIFVLNVVQPTKIWHDFLSAFWAIRAQPILKSHKVHKKDRPVARYDFDPLRAQLSKL